MENEALKVVTDVFAGDEAKHDTVTRRVAIKSNTLQRMRKISSLFCDELPLDAKEPEMISFFLDLSFETFLRSGEIDKRLKTLIGGE